MVILATFQDNPWFALVAAFTLIIGAGYTLWLVKRVVWGEVKSDKVAAMKDLDVNEWIVLGAFAAGVLALGIYPQPLIALMDSAVRDLLQTLMSARI
jgi:NADH-quinone oxidoreductase subunit M